MFKCDQSNRKQQFFALANCTHKHTHIFEPNIHTQFLSLGKVWFFNCASSYASTVLAVVILSVSPSVSRILCDKTKQCTADILIPHERSITLVTWHQQWLAGDASFHLKFALKVDPPPLKHADFNRFPLIMPQPYEIAKVQSWRIGSWPWPFQRAICGVCMLHLSPPKGGSKSVFWLFK